MNEPIIAAADPVVLHPSEILRTACREVKNLNRRLLDLGGRLRATLADAGGIGLAAPQIGASERVIAVRIYTDSGPRVIIMYNPEIRWQSDAYTSMDEGCLSIPGRRFRIERPDAVEAAFMDERGRLSTFRVGGTTAKCIQHEIDHLNGILILDKGEEVFPEVQQEQGVAKNG